MLKKFFGKENGAITLFVLLALLFFIIVIFSVFITSSNKQQFQTSEVDKIKEKYGQSVDNIDQIYNETLTEILSNLLKVGDYVNYTYDTKEEGYNLLATESGYTSNQTVNQKRGMKWRILNIHLDGTVDLIGDISSSDQTIYFRGTLGYNNGVYLLNDICKVLYSNRGLGVAGRSVNLEDIESQMNEEGIAARDAYNSGTATYGNTKTYTGSNTNYPKLYAKENGSGIDLTGETEEERREQVKKNGIEVSENGYSSPTEETSSKANSSLTVTQSYYYFGNTPASYFKDYDGGSSRVRDMIFETGTYYWLASRSGDCYSTIANFGLRYVYSSDLNDCSMFNSVGSVLRSCNRVRPVVSVNIKQILPCTATADGTDTSIQHMHQIRQ